MSNDIVNHPDHYISDSGIETIDVIEAFTKDLDPFQAYCTGNIIKYVCRWKNKNGVEDLKKARWYINKLIGEEINPLFVDYLDSDDIDNIAITYLNGNVKFIKNKDLVDQEVLHVIRKSIRTNNTLYNEEA